MPHDFFLLYLKLDSLESIAIRSDSEDDEEVASNSHGLDPVSGGTGGCKYHQPNMYMYVVIRFAPSIHSPSTMTTTLTWQKGPLIKKVTFLVLCTKYIRYNKLEILLLL